MAKNSDQDIDREEVARILQVTTRTVRTWEIDAKIPAGRIINRRGDKRWNRKEIERIAASLPPIS